MRGRLLIDLDSVYFDEENDFRYQLGISTRPIYDYDFSMNLTSDSKLYEISIEDIKEQLHELLSSSFEYGYDEQAGIIENYLNGKYDVFANLSCVELNGSDESILNFLNVNPELKNKNIIIGGILDLNRETLNVFKNTFGESSNYLVWLHGNDTPVTIDVYEKTIDKIEKMANKIKKYDYSPFERLIHAYDLVRDRIYFIESDDEDLNVSKDLSSVLLGDKIVCAGFATIFEVLLNKLDIKSRYYSLKEGAFGHARNIIYLKDDKYGIDGIYYCDTTWDSKRDASNNFLNVYKFLAKTKTEIESYDNNLVDVQLPNFGYELIDEIQNKYDGKDCLTLPESACKQINYVSKFVDEKTLIYIAPRSINGKLDFSHPFDIDEVNTCMDRYMDLLDSPITSKQFMTALFKVRKNEYYEDPIKYPYSINGFYTALVRSDFELENSSENKFLYSVCGERHNIKQLNSCQKHMDNYVNENQLDRDIEGVKLAKTLRKVLESKKK